jgi:DNA invertase Pin-like site-specific DNA recombinase
MARQGRNVPAFAYLRTCAANLGSDKDSDKRQRMAIAAFAKRAGFVLVGEYYDAAVSGADAIETRPGFSVLLDRLEDNGVRTVIVEDASRFARDVQAHILGIALLRARGVRLLATNGDNLTDDTDEMTEGMLTIAAVFSQIEKKRLVRKLRAARERKRATGAKVEGRRSHTELNPDMVALARRLRRKRPKGGQASLREISRELAARGYLNQRGRPFSATSVRSMLAAAPPRGPAARTRPR